MITDFIIDEVADYHKSLNVESALVILYGSTNKGITSDLDMCVLAHNDMVQWQAVYEFLERTRAKYGLSYDAEVPFSSKLVYNYSDIERVIASPPFHRIRSKYFIRPVENSSQYLASQEMRDRLLINIITTKTTVFGNSAILDSYRARVLEMLLPILYLHIGNDHYAVSQLVEFLCCDPVTHCSYKRWLGYDGDDAETLCFLKQNIQQVMTTQIEKGILEERDSRYKYNSSYIRRSVLGIRPESATFCIDSKALLGLDETSNVLVSPSIDLTREYGSWVNAVGAYPDYQCRELSNKVASLIGIDKSNLLIVPGTWEPIYHLPYILNTTNPTLFVPTFAAYELALSNMGVPFNKVRMQIGDDSANTATIAEHLPSTTLTYLCNPDKFTMLFIDKPTMTRLIEDNPGCHFIVDETYTLFSDEFRTLSVSDLVEKHDNVSVIYSLSKLLNVGGLRVGALVSNSDRVKEYMKRFFVPYWIPTMSQIIVNDILSDPEYIGNTRQRLKRYVQSLVVELATIPFLEVVSNPLLNFLICRVEGTSSSKLCKTLAADSIAIKDLANYHGGDMIGDWVRIGVGDDSTNRILVESLRKVSRSIAGAEPFRDDLRFE